LNSQVTSLSLRGNPTVPVFFAGKACSGKDLSGDGPFFQKYDIQDVRNPIQATLAVYPLLVCLSIGIPEETVYSQ